MLRAPAMPRPLSSVIRPLVLPVSRAALGAAGIEWNARPRGRIRNGVTAVVMLALAAITPGCGDDDDAPTATAPSASTAAAPPALAAGELGALLDALHQAHSRVRGAVGPHRLEVHATFDLTPQGEPATPEPAVDERRPTPQHVDDRLELLWLTTAVNAPRFSLSQSNEHDRGRDIVVDGEQIYTRQRNRGWYVGPLQADLYELWLDDAQRSVYDVIALAAPQLAVSVTPTDGGFASGDGSALRFTLARAASRDLTRVVDHPRSAWRTNAEITEVEGTVVVDARSGAWVSADVRVGFSVPGPDGRPLAGQVAVTALATPVDVATPLTVPSGAQPLLERTRYDAERARLLDGLAGR